MVLDGAVVERPRWQALGGKLWTGAKSPNALGRRVQDSKIVGIPIESALAAIKWRISARHTRYQANG